MTKLTPDQKDKRQTVRRERKAAKEERREVRERTHDQITGGEKTEKDIGFTESNSAATRLPGAHRAD